MITLKFQDDRYIVTVKDNDEYFNECRRSFETLTEALECIAVIKERI